MEHLGYSPNFLSMVIKLHKNQRGKVRLNFDFSGSSVTVSGSSVTVNGEKQGCVLALTLFSGFFSMMLKQVTEYLDNDGAVHIHYCLECSLFNLRRRNTCNHFTV